ncbi:ArsR/SmtB family transcription factor [Streptomyces sp. NPDC004050]
MTSKDLASLASLFADETRAAFLLALLDGRAWTAGELARHAGVAPSTASEHLGKLVAGGVLAEERQGRHRYVRLADAGTAQLVEDLAARGGGRGGPGPPPPTAPPRGGAGGGAAPGRAPGAGAGAGAVPVPGRASSSGAAGGAAARPPSSETARSSSSSRGSASPPVAAANCWTATAVGSCLPLRNRSQEDLL